MSPTVFPIVRAMRVWFFGTAPWSQWTVRPRMRGGSYGWNNIVMATRLVRPPARAPNRTVRVSRSHCMARSLKGELLDADPPHRPRLTLEEQGRFDPEHLESPVTG